MAMYLLGAGVMHVLHLFHEQPRRTDNTPKHAHLCPMQNDDTTRPQLTIFEHIDGARVCKGMFPSYQLPNGKQAYMVSTQRLQLPAGIHLECCVHNYQRPYASLCRSTTTVGKCWTRCTSTRSCHRRGEICALLGTYPYIETALLDNGFLRDELTKCQCRCPLYCSGRVLYRKRCSSPCRWQMYSTLSPSRRGVRRHSSHTSLCLTWCRCRRGTLSRSNGRTC